MAETPIARWGYDELREALRDETAPPDPSLEFTLFQFTYQERKKAIEEALDSLNRGLTFFLWGLVIMLLTKYAITSADPIEVPILGLKIDKVFVLLLTPFFSFINLITFYCSSRMLVHRLKALEGQLWNHYVRFHSTMNLKYSPFRLDISMLLPVSIIQFFLYLPGIAGDLRGHDVSPVIYRHVLDKLTVVLIAAFLLQCCIVLDSINWHLGWLVTFAALWLGSSVGILLYTKAVDVDWDW